MSHPAAPVPQEEREARILVLGLDNAGKTTILKKLSEEESFGPWVISGTRGGLLEILSPDTPVTRCFSPLLHALYKSINVCHFVLQCVGTVCFGNCVGLGSLMPCFQRQLDGF